MPNGLRCHSPALRGSSFCYFHDRPQRTAHPHEIGIEMPVRLESKGIQAIVHRTLSALAARSESP